MCRLPLFYCTVTYGGRQEPELFRPGWGWSLRPGERHRTGHRVAEAQLRDTPGGPGRVDQVAQGHLPLLGPAAFRRHPDDHARLRLVVSGDLQDDGAAVLAREGVGGALDQLDAVVVVAQDRGRA